jgi:hypothetical protein
MSEGTKSSVISLGTFIRCWRVMRLSEADLPTLTAAISDGIVRNVESGAAFAPSQGGRASTPSEALTGAEMAAVADGAAAELGLQTWRLQRRVQSLDAEKNPKECRQLMDSCRRFEKLLESMGVEVVDPIGREYVDGWIEVEVVSWEPAGPQDANDKAMVKRTIAPIIRRAGKIIARGQVVVSDPELSRE